MSREYSSKIFTAVKVRDENKVSKILGVVNLPKHLFSMIYFY